MENPNTWTHAQKVIMGAIIECQKLKMQGMVGFSLPTIIYHALNKSGLIKTKSLVKPSCTGKDEMFCDWYDCPDCGDGFITKGCRYCSRCGIELNWEGA